MDRMFPPPANNQPPRDPHGPHGPFGPYGPHGPHFPEPWHSHYGRYPHPYLHAPHGLHPFFGERPWDHIHCAPECDDQLPIFSTVGRGLRGDSYRVKVAYDAEGETYLEGGYYDANTNTYHTDWTSENINGGHLMYQYNLRTNTNPQTFTITFRYVRPERSESEWVWTTPAIPYIWDADNDGIGDTDNIVGAGVATLFLKKTTDSNWVTPSDANTPHTVAQAKNVQEKLLYPSGWTRSMFNSPAATKPWTVNLEYGVGGDIDVPTVEDLAKIIGVTPDYLREIVNERAIPVNIDFGHDGNGHPYNVKEYIDFHLHNDLFGNHSPNSLPDELGELKHDGSNTQPGYKNYGVWDWILWLKDYVDDNMLDLGHLHDDLFGNHTPSSLPNNLGNLKGDSGSNGVWDWITYAINQAKDHLHNDLFGGIDSPTYQEIAGIDDYLDAQGNPISLVPLKGDNVNGSTVWTWIKYAMSKVKSDIIAPQMYSKTIQGQFVFYDMISNQSRGDTAGTLMLPSKGTALDENIAGNGPLPASVTIYWFDTMPEVFVNITIKQGAYHNMYPSQVGVFCADSNGAHTRDAYNIATALSQDFHITLQNPKLPSETLNNEGYYNGTDTMGITGNFEIFTGLGNIKAAAKNVDWDATASSRQYGGWPWASGTTGTFYLYLISRYVALGDEDCYVQIDFARDYHTNYLRSK